MAPPLLRRTALLGYAVAVLAIAALPGSAIGGGHADKALHAAAYALFVGIVAWARVPVRFPIASAFFLAVAHGAVVEAVQFALPWRSAEWGDLVADAAGAGAAAFCWSLARRSTETAAEENR